MDLIFQLLKFFSELLNIWPWTKNRILYISLFNEKKKVK